MHQAGSSRIARYIGLLIVLILIVGGAGFGGATGTVATEAPRLLTGTVGQASYRIQVPTPWNGTLVLYSHGYVAPGQPNVAHEVSDPVTGAALLAQGYALVGTSYSTTGWALQQAFDEQIAVLDRFTQLVGAPKRTIAWGDSLGGMITAGLVQRNPERFAGALPMCGVVQGGVATWNTELDGAFAFKQLLAPQDEDLQLVNITNPQANAVHALALLRTAQSSPQGRARLALAAAFGQTPDWFDPTAPRPAATDYAARQANQAQWLNGAVFPFGFALRAEVEARAGGNFSFNTGVNYRDLFARSNTRDLAEALYREAGLDLDADLTAIETAQRVPADPAALDYMSRYIVFDGKLAIPVLTMHTLADGLVAPEGETAYRDVVTAAGSGAQLRQTFIERAGHCTFTPAERLAAFAVLVRRIDTGTWDDAALAPAALDAAALALGPEANVIVQANGAAAAPGFVARTPTALLRPFDARTALSPPVPGSPATPTPRPAPSATPTISPRPAPSPTVAPSPTAPQTPTPTPGPYPIPGLPNTGGGGGDAGMAGAGTAGAGLLGALALIVGGSVIRRRRRPA